MEKELIENVAEAFGSDMAYIDVLEQHFMKFGSGEHDAKRLVDLARVGANAIAAVREWDAQQCQHVFDTSISGNAKCCKCGVHQKQSKRVDVVTSPDVAGGGLLPCPFCGGEDLQQGEGIKCETCGAEGPYIGGDSDDAEEDFYEAAWNKRAQSSKSVTLVDNGEFLRVKTLIDRWTDETACGADLAQWIGEVSIDTIQESLLMAAQQPKAVTFDEALTIAVRECRAGYAASMRAAIQALADAGIIKLKE